MEIFFLYDSDGNIEGAGRIDKTWCEENKDSSTALEFIKRKIAAGLNVLYLPDGNLPDPVTQKVQNGQIVAKTMMSKEN